MGKPKGQTFNRYTKEEIMFVVKNWDNMELEEIAKAINRKPESVNYLRTHISLQGVKLIKKNKGDSLVSTIKAALTELRIPVDSNK